MSDRGTVNTSRTERSARSAAELRSEERKVLAVLLLYGALILFAIWGVKVIERPMEKQEDSLIVSEAG
jgi:hypothetical protein